MNTYLIGSLGGSIIFVYLFSALIDWAMMKRVIDDPTQSRLASIGLAWIAACLFKLVLDGGPIGRPFLIYGFGALVVAAIEYRRGVVLRRREEDGEALD